MKSLEERSERDWILNAGCEGWIQKELVALGFVVDETDDGSEVVWYELPNTADVLVADAEARGEFYVEGLALEVAMKAASAEGLGRCARVLWHTHTATASPSAEDISEFPAWLADIGMVYHVPSGTTTLYNSAGVISNSDSAVRPLATGHNDG
jgi:hypothetical protein